MPRQRIVLSAIASLTCLVAACIDTPEPIAADTFDVTVCADGETVTGIDVSHWQANIDWQAVAASGVKFAIIRTSHGLDQDDTKFAQNWAGARANGVIRGAYHYMTGDEDPIAQAERMLSIMGPLEPDDLPPVVDVEHTGGVSPATLAANTRLFIDHVEAATGRTVTIYSGKYFWNDNVQSPDFVDHPLWIPQYGPVCPDLPNPWTEWVFFQTSSTGSIPGISGNVDTDLFNGSLDDLRAFAAGVAVCGDGACTGSETSVDCPGDCPVCAGIPAAGRIVDDGEVCVELGGTASALRVENAGHGGQLAWTKTTDWAAEDNYATWTLAFVEPGLYRVEAYTAAPFAQSTQARYRVRHDGAEDEAIVDQSAVDGWTLLGDYAFAGGGDQWVHLGDNTGEALATSTQIVFDAVRVTRLDGPADHPDGGSGGSADAGGGGGGGDDDGAAQGGCSAGGRGGGSGGALLLLLAGMVLGYPARHAVLALRARARPAPLG